MNNSAVQLKQRFSRDHCYSDRGVSRDHVAGMRPMRRTRLNHCIAAVALVTTILTGSVDSRAQGVRDFGVLPGKLPFRGFGNPHGEEALRAKFPEAAAAVTGDDRSLARMQISKTDANGDGVVNQQEWTDSGYQTPERFPIYDLDGDGLLTLYEHSIGIARWRRRTEQSSDRQTSAQVAAAKQRNTPTPMSAVFRTPPGVDPQVAARQEQVQGLAGYVLQQYDINENGLLERAEYQSHSSRFGDIAGADHDRNGQIGRDEIAGWLHSRLPPLSRLSMELQARDLDHDDQVAFREFVTVADTEYAEEEFSRWDRNGDGLITPHESYLAPIEPGTYRNDAAFVIKPRGSVQSDIWIEDELPIERLQVYVRVTKEGDNFTAISLVSPAGTRVLLFAGNGWQPWSGGLILNGITFSDAAPIIKETLKQPPPPYLRKVRSPGKGTKDDPALSSLRGESTRGTWRLIVRNQNDRAGLLIHWSMIVTPMKVRQ